MTQFSKKCTEDMSSSAETEPWNKYILSFTIRHYFSGDNEKIDKIIFEEKSVEIQLYKDLKLRLVGQYQAQAIKVTVIDGNTVVTSTLIRRECFKLPSGIPKKYIRRDE